MFDQYQPQVTVGQVHQRHPAGKVIQVVGLPAEVTRAEVVRALSCFGYVSSVRLSCDGMALVEFEEAGAAYNCIRYNSTVLNPHIFNWPVKIYRTLMTSVARQYPGTAKLTSGLVLCIEKLTIPVTVAQIRMMFSTVGPVNNVAVLQQGQDTLEAIVEFCDVDTALWAKRLLNGCSVYPGCCVIYIEFVDVKKIFSSSSASEGPDVTEDVDYVTDQLNKVSETLNLRNRTSCSDSLSSELDVQSVSCVPAPSCSHALSLDGFNATQMEMDHFNGTQPCTSSSSSSSPTMPRPQLDHPDVWCRPSPQSFADGNFPLPTEREIREFMMPFDEDNSHDHGHLVIFGLKPSRVSRDSLNDLLKGYGSIINTQLQRDGRKFLACVETVDRETARRIAERLNGATLFGNRVRVRTADLRLPKSWLGGRPGHSPRIIGNTSRRQERFRQSPDRSFPSWRNNLSNPMGQNNLDRMTKHSK
uniref:RRM domain-containing protein n=1 Tax=Trichuris muris TaxID=70415 RepID=A0A5S6QNU5_TRIMR